MPLPSFLGRILVGLRTIGAGPRVAQTLAPLSVLALASGIATYVAMSQAGPDPNTVQVLLILDVLLMMTLGAVVARRVVAVWADQRKGQAGSRLHIRFVRLFSFLAVTPTILMAAFSTLFFNIGVQSWFSERVQTALEASNAVARAYLEEHQQIIGGDALAMANDLNREGALLLRSPQMLGQMVSTQAAIRSLTEALVFEANGPILAKGGLAYSMEMAREQIPVWALEKARQGEVAILTNDDDDRVRALVKLESGLSEIFLFVGRFVDPKVISHMERTNAAVEEYDRLQGRRSGLELTFAAVYVVVALLLLLAAIWIGLVLATRLARPIMELIEAAEAVRSGDLSARVNVSGSDEIGSLSRAFNRMTGQLAEQRQELIDANRELDERRRFTETVLAGVSAGVIGLDQEARIHLPNRSASDLLGLDLEAQVGRKAVDVLPEITDLIEQAERRPERLLQREVSLTRDGRTRIFLIRVAVERADDVAVGYVVTFDDITELLSAQRKAAWADVARRIAHEMKNPLTPIQLSAERLKRKYLKEIKSDPETFIACTDTIVRQVGDIGRMVDEFSSFARMPQPIMKDQDVRETVQQAVFLQRTGFPKTRFETILPATPFVVRCDERLIGQALTNLLKNAAEAVEAREGEGLPAGRVVARLLLQPQGPTIEIEDNGRGLPPEHRERLTEPYVTTRAKGTGLGLAIVKKIMEDHGGDMTLGDAVGGGARVSLVFPHADQSAAAPKETAANHGA
jgi:two-component system nitrogen regulation sensor histidine kinase NtrY